MLEIGSLHVGLPAVAAALSGFSDRPMRIVARRYGAEDLEGHCWYFAQVLAGTRKKTKKATRRKRTAPKKKAKARGGKHRSRK